MGNKMDWSKSKKELNNVIKVSFLGEGGRLSREKVKKAKTSITQV
jgi:hypothetical protein